MSNTRSEEDPPLLFVYADESCLGNQYRDRARPGGAAGLVEFFHQRQQWVRRDYWTSESDTTNNRMAIQSAIIPLNALRQPSRVVFTSDSRYLVDAMTQWIHGWVDRGWKRRTGDVENVSLWRELLQAAGHHQIEWRWVKGHAGHPQNEYANHMATRAAAQQDRSDGLVESAFGRWLTDEQAKGRYQDFSAPPPSPSRFKPARRLPQG